MAEQKYNVKFLGLRDSLPETRHEFMQNMPQLFKVNQDQIEKIIVKAPITLGKNLDLNKAELIARRIESIGGKIQVEVVDKAVSVKNDKNIQADKSEIESRFSIHISRIGNDSSKHNIANYLTKITNNNYILIRQKWLRKLPFKLPVSYSYEEAQTIKGRLEEFGSKVSIKENGYDDFRIGDVKKWLGRKNVIIGLATLASFFIILIGYIEFREARSGLFPIRVNKKYGYIDNKGRIVVRPIFDDAWSFYEGLAAIKIGGKWGFIGKKGRIVITPQFDSVSRFNEGVAIVTISGKHGFVDKTGKTIFNPELDEVLGLFHEGMTRAKIGDKWGYVDKKGKIVIEPQFDECGFFSEGLAPVGVGGKLGFIDGKGTIVINPEFDRGSYFSEGLAAIKIGRKWGYVDKKGKIVIEPQFDDCSPFSKGLAIVKVDGNFSFIDRKGKMVINAHFEDARGFSEELAAVKIGGKWGFISKKGRVVINPQFDDFDDKWDFLTRLRAMHFKDGLAAVKVSGKWGYIDKTGKVVISPQFDGVGLFSEGLAEVRIGYEWQNYIDRTGRIVWGNDGLRNLSKPEKAIMWTSIEAVMIAILLGLIPASIGRSKGRNFIPWWIYGAGLFLVALPHSLLIKTDRAAIEKRKREEGMKKCPFCAEMIKIEAKICRYCSREFESR